MIVILGTPGCGRETHSPQTRLLERPASATSGPPTASTSDLRFTDISDTLEIDFAYRNGIEAGATSIVESLGGGVAVIDYDRDGNPDFFLPGGGRLDPGVALEGLSSGLFRGLVDQPHRDVSAAAGVSMPGRYSHGVAVADYNADGFEDLLVTGYGGLRLYRNQGDGTLAIVTEPAQLLDQAWSTGAAWGDVNGDGHLDLYVVHYVDWSWQHDPDCFAQGDLPDICSPTEFEGLNDTLYLARGDGTFEEATQLAGLVAGGKGLNVLLMDFDADHDTDIYVANDTTENFFYLNQGDGRFLERGTLAGAAYGDNGSKDGSMGLSVLDYNGDSLPDIWVTNFESNSFALYRNVGEAAFMHVSGTVGLLAIGTSYVGWGTVTDDVDGDGDEDIVVANGHVSYHPHSGSMRQKPLVLWQQDHRFEPHIFANDQYLGQKHNARGLAKCDLDSDGDWDLAFTHLNAPLTVLRNDRSPSAQAPAGHWIGVQLVGVASNRDAIGATIRLSTEAGPLRTQFVSGGGSYLSHHDARKLWRLPPPASTVRLQIEWPSGNQQQLLVKPRDQYITVVESP